MSLNDELVLFINGIAFYRLPEEGELCPETMDAHYWSQLTSNPDDEISALNSIDHDSVQASYIRYHEVYQEQGPFEDELRSHLYSPNLEILRETVIAALPQADEVLSRSIINAFVDLPSSGRHEEGPPFTRPGLDAEHFEVEALAHASSWLDQTHVDSEEAKLEQLQVYVDAIFVRMRKEGMNAEEASRIILNTASALGLPFARELSLPSVLLQGYKIAEDEVGIVTAMSRYGTIESYAFSADDSFCCCHFLNEDAAESFATDTEEFGLTINRKTVFVSKLSTDVASKEEEEYQLREPEESSESNEEDRCSEESQLHLLEKYSYLDETTSTRALSTVSPSSISRSSPSPMSSFGSEFNAFIDSPDTVMASDFGPRKKPAFYYSTSNTSPDFS